jgi:hypothetical protein
LVYVAVLGSGVMLLDIAMERADDEYPLQHSAARAPLVAVSLFVMTALFGATSSNAFVYFQF